MKLSFFTMQSSIKEVVYMIGMSDSKYFAKCFKKKYGVSPMKYKACLRK